MKIVFICGSLCPGRDGVGDYTRRLAHACTTAGHKCLLVSLCDEIDSETIEDGLHLIRCQRILDRPPAEQQALLGRIKSRRPDWISLQFVCFAFHPKGLIHRLTPLIGKLSDTAPLHIMFHELWLGEKPSLPFKHKVLGWMQRWQILHALKQCQPEAIHTSNTLYQTILRHEGYEAKLLPLFSNIRIAEADVATLRREFEWFDRIPNERVLVFPFSQRHDWDAQATLHHIRALADAAGVSIRLIQVGNLRSGQKHWGWISEFAKSRDWPCHLLGFVSEETVSHVLQAADIGISTDHVNLSGKSGAVAAMLEHGLPVICTVKERLSKRFTLSMASPSRLYSFYDDTRKLEAVFRHPESAPPQSRIPMITDQWLKDLQG